MVEASISYTESETLYNNLKSQEICCCRCICYSSWFIAERIKVSCIKNIEEVWWVIRGINLKWSLKNKKSSKKGLPKFANCFFVRLHTVHFFTLNVYLSLIENVIIPPIYSKKSGLENTGDHIFHGFFPPPQASHFFTDGVKLCSTNCL